MTETKTLNREVLMTHAFNSGCPCCLPQNGLSRRQFLCTTAAGVAAAPALAASVDRRRGGGDLVQPRPAGRS